MAKVKSRSLSANWTIECHQDLQSEIGIEVAEQIANNTLQNIIIESVRVTPKIRRIQEVVHMDREYCKHFLRLNNRKKYHTVQDLKKEGYPSVTIPYKKRDDAILWCKKNLPDGSFCFYSTTFWFPTEKHSTLFSLVWS